MYEEKKKKKELVSERSYVAIPSKSGGEGRKEGRIGLYTRLTFLRTEVLCAKAVPLKEETLAVVA